MTFEQFMVNLWEAFTTIVGGELTAVTIISGVFIATGLYIRGWLKNKVKKQEDELTARRNEIKTQSNLINANVELNSRMLEMLSGRVKSLEADQAAALARAAEYLTMYKEIHSKYVETITLMAKQGTEMALIVQDRKHLQEQVTILTREKAILEEEVQRLKYQVGALEVELKSIKEQQNRV